jgi:PAS domain S-box-containing protein
MTGPGSSLPRTVQTDSPATQRLAMLETLVDASNDAMFAMDAQGRIVLWNRSAERLCGYAGDDVLAGPLPVLFRSDVREAAAARVAAVLSGDRVERWETMLESRSGMSVSVSLSLHPVVAADGARCGAVAIAYDTTEERLAQELLAESEARLQESEALAHVGRWLWDVPSGSVQWSAEFHRIHGVDPLEFEGTIEAHLECVVRGERSQVRDALERAVATGRAVDIDYVIQRPDASLRKLSTRAEPAIGASGDVVGLRGIGRDVTDT